MAGEVRILALIVFVFFSIQFVMQLLTIILIANQQPAKASFLNFLGSLFALIIIFFLTKTTEGNLVYLGAAFSSAPVPYTCCCKYMVLFGRVQKVYSFY